MGEVIKKWIANSVGIVMNMNPENFARDVRDGSIIARILRNYNIITEEQRLKVIQGDDPNVNYKNFKYIRVWLNAIGITCTDEDVSEISKGKCLSAIKLFYQIYLALHDKDELYYTSKRRGNERLHPTDTRFEVVSVNETTEKDFVDFTDNPFCEQLTLQRDTIEWNKERYEELESAYKTMRERYSMYLQQKFGVKYVNKFEKSFAIKHTTSNLEELNEPDVEDDKDYDELMKLVQDFKKKPTFKENANVSASILTKLKIKRRQEVKDNEIKVQQQKFMLMELWKKLLEEQGKELETEISKKMLKQSVFEKQMSTKMFEVRQQKDNIMQNCKCINDEILRRREEEFMEHVFLRNKCAPDQKDNYYFEKYRMLELHRRLYAEKQRLKSEREMKMCTDVVKYLVDLSIRYSEYKDEHKIEPCRCIMKEWVNLFIKDQPLTPYMDDLTDLTVDTEIPEDAEEIFYLEFYRQEALDEREFEDYMNLEWPWELDQLLPHLRSNLLDIELGMNVLGHGVHRVLYKLYPSRLPLPKPDIPLVNVAVCINGLPNLSVLPVMQKLLLKKKIQIIEMRDVINSGLQAYKDEMKMQDVDIVLISETQTTLDKSHKKKKSELLKKGTKSSQGSHKQRTPATITFEVKETQTPAIYPCEEMQLTRRGELGKMAYETLNVGDELTDNLMIAMFIEYLKTFTDVNGWALINYPTNFSQAALLEEALNGVPIPNISDILKNEASPSIGDVSDLNYRSSVFGLEEKNARLRTSKLVPNPETVYENDFYNTYLTAYIKIEHQSARDKSKGEDVVESPLDQYYSNQGCSYSFYYDTFQLNEIKELTRKIIGEYSIPSKTSEELFGDTVNYLEANLNHSGTRDVSVLTSKESITKTSSNSIEKVSSSPEVRIKNPGDKYWQYVDLEMPHFLEIELATFWENLEKIYINDFKQLFFIRRIVLNAIMPYLSHVRNHVDTFLSRPDSKQHYLSQFQKYFNEIDADMRDDAEVKAEVHCTISEFREKLWQICDTRMKEAESERLKIIADSWLPYQLVEIVNNTISSMQLELDRCCDCLQFITDYYSGVITKMPSKDPPMQKTRLDKISSEHLLNSSFETSTAIILTEIGSSIDRTPFHVVIEQNCQQSQSNLIKYEKIANGCLYNTNNVFNPKDAKVRAKKDTGKKANKLVPLFEPLPEVKEAAPNLFAEWLCVINGEYQRATLRINIISEKGLTDVNNVMLSFQTAFHSLFNNISNRYQREIDSVNTACEVFSRAAEAETNLQPQLFFQDDQFFIDPNVLLFPDPVVPPKCPVKEHTSDATFTIAQLDALTNTFINLAPNGSIPERNFVFVLQDIIVQDTEDGKKPLVPKLWQMLNPCEVEQLSKLMFGDVEFINWRDFIIYNFGISFPTIESILKVRAAFREKDPNVSEVITGCQFFSTKLWFENECEQENREGMLRLCLIKQLLFKLYKVGENILNYTALLLDFCKSDTAEKGFTKALALAFGKEVCQDVILGDIYVASIKEQIFIDERMEQMKQVEDEEILKCVESVVSSLINAAVDSCDSIVIESIPNPYPCEVAEEMRNFKEISLKSEEEEEEEEEEGDEQEEEVEQNHIEVPCKKISKFSNIGIAYQPHYNTNYIYLLDFESVCSILTATLPWHARAQTVYDRSIRECLETIYDLLKDSKLNNSVWAHVLLNDKSFKRLLMRSSKFVEKLPIEIVIKLLGCNEMQCV